MKDFNIKGNKTNWNLLCNDFNIDRYINWNLLCNDFNLLNGDITPEQLITIETIIKQFITQNK